MHCFEVLLLDFDKVSVILNMLSIQTNFDYQSYLEIANSSASVNSHRFCYQRILIQVGYTTTAAGTILPDSGGGGVRHRPLYTQISFINQHASVTFNMCIQFLSLSLCPRRRLSQHAASSSYIHLLLTYSFKLFSLSLSFSIHLFISLLNPNY